MSKKLKMQQQSLTSLEDWLARTATDRAALARVVTGAKLDTPHEDPNTEEEDKLAGAAATTLDPTMAAVIDAIATESIFRTHTQLKCCATDCRE
jgi:hypothetical protein